MSGKLDRRLAALAEAVGLADGRLEPERVEAARAVVRRAGQRLGLGVEATVVALAGPTGAGKSSLFNALAGGELAATSARRPTTGAASAAVWGDSADALLDWLQVPRRHRMQAQDGAGLVLLDLPDFDSVELDHRVEVERLLELVDLFVWVVDPQKYADAALHERYLAELADYEETMVVALNQADRLDAAGREACRADLQRVLRGDGLDGVPVLLVSARSGDGLAELQRLLARRVAARSAAVERLAADLTTTARALAEGCGDGAPGKVGRSERERLAGALAEAAGVPTVVVAVGRAHRRRGALATGWPLVRWLRRLRPDPLKRLRLPDRPEPDLHTSLPAATPVQRARVSAATRALAARAAGDMPPPWPGLVRTAATAREEEVAERLDRAVAGADLRMTRPRWWRVAGALQALLAGALGVGALWLLVLAGLGFLRIEDVLPLPNVEGVPVPTLLVGGGALAGLLVALLARFVNGAGARRRSRAAGRALRTRIEEVGTELVVEPVEAELRARERLCAALTQAAGRAGPLSGLAARRARREAASPPGQWDAREAQ